MLKKTILFLAVLATSIACTRQSRHEIIDVNSTDRSEVLRYLEDLETEHPNDDAIYYQKARTFVAGQDYRRAKIEINRALKLREFRPEYNALNGEILSGLGQYDDAVEALLRAEANGQQNPLTYKLLAEAYLKTNQTEKAQGAVARLLAINTNAPNLIIAANVYYQLGDTDLSAEYYRKAVSLEAKNSEAREKLTKIYLDQGKVALAEQLTDDGLTQHPEKEVFLRFKASILMSRNSLDTAALLYEKLISRQGDNVTLLNEYAGLQYQRHIYDSALLLADQSLKKDSTQFDVLFIKARSYDKVKEYDLSEASYNAIIKLDSTNDIAREELEILKRKVAYLWRLKQERVELENSRNVLPPSVQKKDIEN